MLRFSVLALALTLVVACGGSGDDDDGGEPIGTVSAQDAVSVVESFGAAEEASVAELNELVYAGGDEVVPALAPLLDSEDPNQRWAALYVIGVLADTDAEIAVLEPMLEDDDEILRLMAAGSLAGRGVTDALPVLIEGLSSEADLPFSDPSRPLSGHARFALEELTGETFADAAEWEDWWEDVKNAIRWEDDRYVTG